MSTPAKVKPIPPKPEKKHQPQTSCQEGKHTYVVTHWQIGGGQQKAQTMRCQHCLMPMNMMEIESAAWAKSEGLDV